MRIRYCALDHEVFIVQYEKANTYLLHIRGLRSLVYCHEIETNQEITCHTKVDFSLTEEVRVVGLFFGTAAGRVKFFNVKRSIAFHGLPYPIFCSLKIKANSLILISRYKCFLLCCILTLKDRP